MDRGVGQAAEALAVQGGQPEKGTAEAQKENAVWDMAEVDGGKRISVGGTKKMLWEGAVLVTGSGRSGLQRP